MSQKLPSQKRAPSIDEHEPIHSNGSRYKNTVYRLSHTQGYPVLKSVSMTCGVYAGIPETLLQAPSYVRVHLAHKVRRTAMPITCTAVSGSGFFSGLFDGCFALIKLVASIFFNVRMYDHCSSSWWYDAMFLIGFGASLAIGLTSPTVSILALMISFICYVIWLIFANLIYVAGFIAVSLIAVAVYDKFKRPDPKAPFVQNDGSEVPPPSA